MPRDPYKRSWAETYQPGTREHASTLRHACILIHPHVDKDNHPSPCRCACDPVPELRVSLADVFASARA